MRELYARVVLWLIRPALDRRDGETLKMVREQMERSRTEAAARFFAESTNRYRNPWGPN